MLLVHVITLYTCSSNFVLFYMCFRAYPFQLFFRDFAFGISLDASYVIAGILITKFSLICVLY